MCCRGDSVKVNDVEYFVHSSGEFTGTTMTLDRDFEEPTAFNAVLHVCIREKRKVGAVKKSKIAGLSEGMTIQDCTKNLTTAIDLNLPTRLENDKAVKKFPKANAQTKRRKEELKKRKEEAAKHVSDSLQEKHKVNAAEKRNVEHARERAAARISEFEKQKREQKEKERKELESIPVKEVDYSVYDAAEKRILQRQARRLDLERQKTAEQVRLKQERVKINDEKVKKFSKLTRERLRNKLAQNEEVVEAVEAPKNIVECVKEDSQEQLEREKARRKETRQRLQRLHEIQDAKDKVQEQERARKLSNYRSFKQMQELRTPNIKLRNAHSSQAPSRKHTNHESTSNRPTSSFASTKFTEVFHSMKTVVVESCIVDNATPRDNEVFHPSTSPETEYTANQINDIVRSPTYDSDEQSDMESASDSSSHNEPETDRIEPQRNVASIDRSSNTLKFVEHPASESNNHHMPPLVMDSLPKSKSQQQKSLPVWKRKPIPLAPAEEYLPQAVCRGDSNPLMVRQFNINKLSIYREKHGP